MINYLQYLLSGKNVGPLGFSEYTEKKPIEIPQYAFRQYIEQVKQEITISSPSA